MPRTDAWWQVPASTSVPGPAPDRPVFAGREHLRRVVALTIALVPRKGGGRG